jgi:S1/P1 Nuclease
LLRGRNIIQNQITAILAACVLFTSSASAWNSDGHMQVAEIAWQHLTAASRGRVSTLLMLNPMYNAWIAKVPAAKRKQVAFVMAAAWPDYIKKNVAGYTNDSDTPPTGSASSQNIGYADHLMHRYWHFIDTPFSSDGTALVQPAAPNAKTQIELFTSAIADAETSADIKSYDLVWLEHLAGDVHQPLHATSRFSADLPMGDRGGNLVVLCANPCKTKGELHAFWDNVLGVSNSPTAAIAAADKLPAAPGAGAALADDQAWITESFDAARKFVYASPVGAGTGPFTLSAAYKSQAKTEAKARVELAGRRLANLINANLK